MELDSQKTKLKLTFKMTLLATALLSTQAGAAVVIEHSGQVELNTRYHSNLRFRNGDAEESVTLYSLIPRYKISALDGKNTWFGTIGVNIERASNDNVSNDREDPFAELGWERLLENGLFNVAASYKEESTRTTQFTETGRVDNDGTTKFKSISATWEHAINQQFSLITGTGYKKVEFGGDAAGLSDYDDKYVQGQLMYLLNDQVSPYVRVKANQYRANAIDGTSETNYQTYLGGAEVTLNNNWSFNVNTGFVELNGDDDEWVGEFISTYENARHSIETRIGRTVFPSGISKVILGDALATEYTYLMTDRSTIGAELVLTQNNSDVESQSITGFYDRELTPEWLVNVQLSYRNRELPNVKSADDTSIGIFFTYTSPKF